ncbi:hypothetical protein GCK32_005965 [Trichostrongylus colubriformis]|uniref:Uncharacterized protein n=1 Tax=Trichostrongylus colubriformis TaxID=6319 RepID=A0AAN8FNL8_TRICO
MRDSVEEESPEKQEKTPEEMARLKRQPVITLFLQAFDMTLMENSSESGWFNYVLMELVETEKDYVRDLSSVVDGYIANLEKMELPADLVGKDKIIFANIAQILEFHKNSFLKEIEKCLDNYEVAGSAFVKYKGRLETMYVRYCQNKPKSDYLVSQEDFEQPVQRTECLIYPVQLQTPVGFNRREPFFSSVTREGGPLQLFVTFIIEEDVDGSLKAIEVTKRRNHRFQFFAETKAKLGHKVALSDLLIKPVQRIMKYQLLLKDILKFTERAKEKTDMLKKALVVMHVVPKACDDMMQVGRLQNFDGSLNAQGKLLYQGTLPISDSQGGTSQKSKDRRIFLFEQSVIIADHIPPKKEFGNPIYIFKNQIMVNKMLFEPSVPDDPLKFIIRSSDPAQPTAFIATAQTQEEKNEWVRYISEQLDQQKRMLAALVDPRRFMGGATDDLSGSMAGMGLSGDSKKSPSGGGGGGAGTGSSRHNANTGSSKGGSGSKPESPKKESKGTKLFGFGKKSSTKSPTSPPPVGKLKKKNEMNKLAGSRIRYSQRSTWPEEPLRGVACCAYRHLRKGEVDLEPGEQVDILDVFGGYSHVLKRNGQEGSVPSYFLELVDIPGDTLVEQIDYRRMWHTVVDELIPTDDPISPLSCDKGTRAIVPMVPDGRPVFVVPLADVSVCEGDQVILHPEISSTTPFEVTWRGPAVEAGRAKVESDGETTSLTISKVTELDCGPYSVVAKNDYDPPSWLICKRIGRNALLLSWNPGFKKGLYYGVEFKSADMEQFRCVASALRATTISLRNFRPVLYYIRLFSYNFGLRSRPSEEKEVDFSKEFSLLENTTELSSSIKLGEICGRGRFSIVYEATLLKTQRNVVVKVLLPEVSKTDIEREVAVLSVLHHSSLPRLKGVFTSDDRYCIAMKRMPGVVISTYVDEFVHIHDESGELERLLRHLSTDILGALGYLHARNIVHLDVKPSNLLVSDHVSLIDFGCARFVGSSEAMAWTDSDKSYSAPERIAGKPPSTASDVWSFGAVLFELCFGVAPHRMLTTLTMNPERRSQALLSFLNEVLALEASRRPTAEECLQKGWFKRVTHLEVPHEIREFSRSVSFEG